MKIKFGVEAQTAYSVFMPKLGMPFDLHRLLDFAVIAEESGFDSVWVPDGLVQRAVHRPIPVLSAIAMKTKTIRIGSSIIVPHFYNNPLLLTQEWTTLDILSRGRSAFGLGVGGGRLQRDFEVSRVDKQVRGRIFNETLSILKKLWSEPEVTYHGEFYTLDKVQLGYQPMQRPHPPIYIAAGIFRGTHHPERRGFQGVWDRVARFADGWHTNHCTPGEFAAALGEIRKIAAETYGRPADAIEPVLFCGLNVNDSVDRAFEEAKWGQEMFHNYPMTDEIVRRWNFLGPAERCIKEIQAYIDAGARTFEFVLRTRDPIGQLQRVAREILPAFR